MQGEILMLGNNRRWGGSEPVFQRIIGRGLATDYYPGYLRDLAVTLDKPVAQCEFPV